MTADHHSQLANFIWSICNLLRGPYKRNEYRKVILPLTVLRRFDCLLAPTKAQVLARHSKIKAKPETVVRSLLEKITGRPFYNLSKLDFPRLLDDPNQLAPNLNAYINGYSKNVREVMENFAFDQQIARMAEKNLLYEVVKKFAAVDLSPERVDNVQMGYVFEELIRIGAEQSNEEAGEHFTPREVIRLMVNLLLSPERDLRKSYVVKTIYDPACGTGGMLSVAEKYIRDLNAQADPAPVRPGLERRILGRLQGGHADQGRGRGQHRPRRYLHQGRIRPGRRGQETHIRLHAGQSAVRCGVEATAEGHPA